MFNIYRDGGTKVLRVILESKNNCLKIGTGVKNSKLDKIIRRLRKRPNIQYLFFYLM